MAKIVTFSRLGRYGRFANQLWQIAGTIGIARKNGFDFAFPYWQNRDGLNFESNIDIDVQKHFENPLPLFDGTILHEQSIPWGYHNVTLTRNTDLIGHFQSEKYFSHCLDEVRHYFRMQDEPPVNDYVAVHFRGKDYGSDYHPRMTMDYYEQAMAIFPSAARFLVFSDDIPEARKMFGKKVEYSEGQDYLDDFRLMKTCKHFIIANSSYSAMAAVLGEARDKKVVAPRPWFGSVAGIDGEDVYSDGWTVIDYSRVMAA
jgi:hypothetical protein